MNSERFYLKKNCKHDLRPDSKSTSTHYFNYHQQANLMIIDILQSNTNT